MMLGIDLPWWAMRNALVLEKLAWRLVYRGYIKVYICAHLIWSQRRC